MLISTVFSILLILATLLCALVAGLLFTFSVVTMPGIKKLNNREFIRTFQVIDGVIQNNQPLFMLVWVGSVVTLLGTAGLALGQLTGIKIVLMATATPIYLFGVQLPTGIIHIPLNNQLQRVQVDQLSASEQERTRIDFESRWNRSNQIRTVFAILASAILLVLLFML